MKNIFITSIPLQSKKDLQKIYYKPEGIELGEEIIETSFPIIPIIKCVTDEEKKNEELLDCKIIIAKMKNDDTERNQDLFIEELEKIGIGKESVEIVELTEDSERATGVKMFFDLLKCIEDDSDVYACITYGTKVMSCVVSYLMSCISKIKRNTFVKGIYYGQAYRVGGKVERASLWDVTGVLKINEIVNSIENLGLSNTEDTLRRLLDMED